MRRQKSYTSKVNSHRKYKSKSNAKQDNSTSFSKEKTKESEKSVEDKSKSNINDPEKEAINKFLVTGHNLLTEKSASIPYLLTPILQQTGVVSIVGSSDTGKSSFLRQFATAIVHGDTNFLEFKINSRFQRVIYVSTEDDRVSIAHLLATQNINNVPKEKYINLGFIFDSHDLLNKIALILKKFPSDCVILDAFADLYEGDMNQSNKVRSYLNKYSTLADKYQCLFIFLHHTGKRTEELAPSKNNTIGSQGFESKMRMVIELRKDFSDPTIRHMCIVKGNYLPQEYKESSYVLKFENMRFTYLNRRVPFDQLAKNGNENNPAKEKAIEYKRQGNSVREIVRKLLQEGFKVSKSAVGIWTKNISSNQSFYGYESDDPEVENQPN